LAISSGKPDMGMGVLAGKELFRHSRLWMVWGLIYARNWGKGNLGTFDIPSTG